VVEKRALPLPLGATLRLLVLLVAVIVVLLILVLLVVVFLVIVVVGALGILVRALLLALRALFAFLVLIPFQGLVVLQLLLFLGVEFGQVVVLFVLDILGRRLLVRVLTSGHVIENRGELLEGVDGFALDEIGVLVLADFVLHLVDRQLRFEGEQIVEHLDAAARQVIEQVGVRAVLLIENIRQREQLLLGFEQRFLHALQPHLAGAEIAIDAKRNEGRLEDVLIETVVAQRIDQLDEMLDLTRIDDAEPVHIPADRIARFSDPPIVVVSETNNAPVESVRLRHERNFRAACEGSSKKQAQKDEFFRRGFRSSLITENAEKNTVVP
jgi:hypothetical protein